MQSYLNLLRQVLDEGVFQDNRTGIRTKAISGAMLKFDLANGQLPVLTTKKLAYKSVTAELVGFLRGYTSAADFRRLGTSIWDANANSNRDWLSNPNRRGEDDLGKGIYGDSWRRWEAYKRLPRNSPAWRSARLVGYTSIGHAEDELGGDSGDDILFKPIDQLRDVLHKLMFHPTDRRIIATTWNPAILDAIALAPCHSQPLQFNVNVRDRELSLCMMQRSVDTFLGLGFNLCSTALLLSFFAHLTGYKPRFFTWFGGDVHIYENHIEAVQEQLTRAPLPPPTLKINPRVPTFNGSNAEEIYSWLDKVEPTDFELVDYQHHAPIKAPMAV